MEAGWSSSSVKSAVGLKAGLAGAEVPEALVRRQQRADYRLPAIGTRRDTQQHDFKRLEQVAGDRQFPFIAGVVEGRLDLVAQAAAIAFLVV